MSIKHKHLELSKDLDFLLEALLIQFSYISELKIFELISDCVNWELERGKREFKKLKFSDVEQYNRLFGAGKSKLEESRNKYSVNEFEGACAFQEIKVILINSDFYEIEVYFDNFFGGFKFQCKSAEMYTRIGVGKEVGEDEWIYLDEDTEEVFDFYNPFST
jgi:hypothetical protein